MRGPFPRSVEIILFVAVSFTVGSFLPLTWQTISRKQEHSPNSYYWLPIGARVQEEQGRQPSPKPEQRQQDKRLLGLGKRTSGSPQEKKRNWKGLHLGERDESNGQSVLGIGLGEGVRPTRMHRHSGLGLPNPNWAPKSRVCQQMNTCAAGSL